jgi:hypothetical protein
MIALTIVWRVPILAPVHQNARLARRSGRVYLLFRSTWARVRPLESGQLLVNDIEKAGGFRVVFPYPMPAPMIKTLVDVIS